MIFYYSTGLLIFSLYFFTISQYFKKYNKIIIFSSIVLLGLIVGLRWKMATDWEPYYYNFNEFDFDNDNFEIGYKFFILFFRKLSDNYSFFLLFYTFSYLFIFYLSLLKLKLPSIISVLLYFCLTLGVWGSHRQLMALSICFYALFFLFNDRNKLFLLFILIAITFHYSALFCLLFYIVKIKIPKFFYLVIFFLMFIFGSFLGEYLINKAQPQNDLITFDKLFVYIDGVSKIDVKSSGFGLIKRILLFLFFYYHALRIPNKLYFLNFFKIYFLGLIIYFLFKDSFPIMMNRGSLYFNLMEIYMVPIILLEYKNKAKHFSFLICILFYFLIMINQSIISYKDLFIPYQSIFFNNSYSRPLY